MSTIKLAPVQVKLLQEAIAKLNEADALVQQALGATDACYDIHLGIQEIVDDLECDIEEAY